MKVLIVDDNPDILETTALVLELDHHEVITVQFASEIEATCRAERPDVVFQDAGMPGLRLEELVARMGSDPDLRDIPVVIFSAQTPPLAVMNYPSVIGFLAKPFALAELREWMVKINARS